jgi:hypothetical protein
MITALVPKVSTMAIVNRSGNNDAMQLGINHQNSGSHRLEGLASAQARTSLKRHYSIPALRLNFGQRL